MLSNDLNIVKYLNLKNVGVLELSFALTPVLSAFSIIGIPLSLLMWMILLFIVFLKNGKLKLKNYRPFTLFVVYWGFHEFVTFVFDEVNFWGFVQQITIFISLYALYPYIDRSKLKGSMNWIMLISIIGLISQWFDIARGIGVRPIEIPGLALPANRLDTTLRPSSFFMEPAVYVAYAMCPLTFALIEKKWFWAVSIILSCFLTTSTTGLLISFVMLIASLFSSRFKMSTLVIVLFLAGGLYYSLTSFEIFESGVEKLEKTDTEGNIRLRQGQKVVGTMHSEEYVFGVPYSTPYNYCKSGRTTDVVVFGQNEVYMSTFWYMLLLYGVVGLLLYLNIYWQILKRDKTILPLIIALCVTLFSTSNGIGGGYIYTLIFLLVLSEKEKWNKRVKNE